MQYYEDWEIRELYLGAKNKEAEIAIIAQMCLTGENKIRNKLKKMGIKDIPGANIQRCSRWTPEANESLIAAIKQGKTYREIAVQFETSIGSIKQQLSRLRMVSGEF